jgi:hypothetical protein
MANTGAISVLDFNTNGLYVTKGKAFTKIYLPGKMNDIIITIKNTEKNLIDLETRFKPATRDMADYFIQVESKVNSKG